MNCRICGHAHLIEVADLGRVPNVNALTKKHEASVHYPLRLMECASCGFWQLDKVPPSNDMFPATYPYRSATTPELATNFVELYARTKSYVPTFGSVVDIGGNDGTLLGMYHGQATNVEPTNAGRESPEHVKWVQCFWNTKNVQQLWAAKSVDLILATNVFAHADDLDDMARAVEWSLGKDGVFVAEVQDRKDLVFDTIYHEHVGYYRPRDLERLMGAQGLYLFRLESIPTHGGSFRAYFRREPAVCNYAEEWPSASRFREDMRVQVNTIRQEVMKRKLLGQRLWAVGAPSRGTTLLHVTGIAPLLEGVAEMASSPKCGLQMPGTNVMVRPDSDMFLSDPDAVILLSWHLPSLAGRLRTGGYRGDIITPLRGLNVDTI